MSIYTAAFARARALIAKKGAPITFPGAVPGTAGAYDPLTDTFGAGTPATDAASVAAQVDGDPDTYQALSLIQSNPVTLVVAASGLAITLRPGMPFVWAGTTYTIRLANPTGPDGTPGFYDVVGSA